MAMIPFVTFDQKILVAGYKPIICIFGKIFNLFARNVNRNLQTLCCKFNVKFSEY